MKKPQIETEDWDVSETEALAAMPVIPTVTAPVEEPMPDNFAGLLAEIERLDKLRPKTRDEELAIRARREKVSKRAFEIQQLPPAPVFTADHWAQRKQHEDNRPSFRQERLEKLAKAFPTVRALIKTATKNP
ncbi:MAG TPA: hypothetical protein VN873_02465 [Candidatus Angelobacter sp.]|nr:hypothetical protein [Candidatus Angelobacter sp.]